MSTAIHGWCKEGSIHNTPLHEQRFRKLTMLPHPSPPHQFRPWLLPHPPSTYAQTNTHAHTDHQTNTRTTNTHNQTITHNNKHTTNNNKITQQTIPDFPFFFICSALTVAKSMRSGGWSVVIVVENL